ncbi:MAG: hypothetical protein ACJ75B_13625 [Flavisolibacter sp.]
MKPVIFFLATMMFQQTRAQSIDSIPGGNFHESILYLSNIFDFTVQRLSSGHVLVSWHATVQTTDSGFVLERKKENEGVFVPVGFIASRSDMTGTSILDYSFRDNNNFKGASFYRIRQTDHSGKNYFTAAKQIKSIER